jgi:hypothetical protein
MAENKTKETDQSIESFLDALNDPQKKQDSLTLVELMQEVTGKPPKMWGASMIGFGSYHYKYASGREGDSFIAGFSPRKPHLVIYNMGGQDPTMIEKLGKCKMGGGCLYIKKLSDVDRNTLKALISTSVTEVEKRYPSA